MATLNLGTLGLNAEADFSNINRALSKLEGDISKAFSGNLAKGLTDGLGKAEASLSRVSGVGNRAAQSFLNIRKSISGITSKGIEQLRSRTSGLTAEFQKLEGATTDASGRIRDAQGRFLDGADASEQFFANLSPIGRVGASLGAFAATAGVAAAGISKLTSASREFNKSIAEVATLVDQTKVSNSELADSVKRVAAQYGGDLNNQAQALYQIISAGAEAGADANRVLDAANRLAVGGVTDVATAADGLTSAMNAFGKSVPDDVVNQFFSAMRLGKTTIGEISGSIGQVAATAAKFGIPLEEVLASMVEITKRGVSTSEAFTQINAVLTAAARGTKQSQEAADALGISFNTASLRSKGLVGTLSEIADAADGNEAAVVKLFGRVEGAKAVFNAASDGGKDLASTLKTIATDTTSAANALATVQATEAQGIEVAAANFQILKTEIGDLVSELTGLPSIISGASSALISITGAVKSVVDVIRNLNKQAEDNAFAALASGAVKLAGTLGTLAIAFKAARASASLLSSVLPPTIANMIRLDFVSKATAKNIVRSFTTIPGSISQASTAAGGFINLLRTSVVALSKAAAGIVGAFAGGLAIGTLIDKAISKMFDFRLSTEDAWKIFIRDAKEALGLADEVTKRRIGADGREVLASGGGGPLPPDPATVALQKKQEELEKQRRQRIREQEAAEKAAAEARSKAAKERAAAAAREAKARAEEIRNLQNQLAQLQTGDAGAGLQGVERAHAIRVAGLQEQIAAVEAQKAEAEERAARAAEITQGVSRQIESSLRDLSTVAEAGGDVTAAALAGVDDVLSAANDSFISAADRLALIEDLSNRFGVSKLEIARQNFDDFFNAVIDETESFPDQLQDLLSFDLDPGLIQEGIGKIIESATAGLSQEDQVSTLNNLRGALESLGLKTTEVDQALSGLGASVRQSAGQLAANAGLDLASQAAGEFSSTLNSAMQGFQAGGPVGAAIGAIADLASQTESFGEIQESIGDVLGLVVDAIDPLVGAIASGLQPVFETLESVIGAVTPALEIIGDTLGSLLQSIFDPIQRVIQPLVEALQPVITLAAQLATAFTPLTELVIELSFAFDPLFLALRGLTAILKVLSKPIQIVSNLVGRFSNALRAILTPARLLGAIFGALGKAVEFVIGVIKKIGAPFGFLGKVVGGIAKPFIAAGKAVGNFVKGLFGGGGDDVDRRTQTERENDFIEALEKRREQLVKEGKSITAITQVEKQIEIARAKQLARLNAQLANITQRELANLGREGAAALSRGDNGTAQRLFNLLEDEASQLISDISSNRSLNFGQQASEISQSANQARTIGARSALLQEGLEGLADALDESRRSIVFQIDDLFTGLRGFDPQDIISDQFEFDKLAEPIIENITEGAAPAAVKLNQLNLLRDRALREGLDATIVDAAIRELADTIDRAALDIIGDGFESPEELGDFFKKAQEAIVTNGNDATKFLSEGFRGLVSSFGSSFDAAGDQFQQLADFIAGATELDSNFDSNVAFDQGFEAILEGINSKLISEAEKIAQAEALRARAIEEGVEDLSAFDEFIESFEDAAEDQKEAAEKQKEAADALSNVPSGFRTALNRFQSSAAESASASSRMIQAATQNAVSDATSAAATSAAAATGSPATEALVSRLANTSISPESINQMAEQFGLRTIELFNALQQRNALPGPAFTQAGNLPAQNQDGSRPSVNIESLTLLAEDPFDFWEQMQRISNQQGRLQDGINYTPRFDV